MFVKDKGYIWIYSNYTNMNAEHWSYNHFHKNKQNSAMKKVEILSKKWEEYLLCNLEQ